jgi:hypothetical protein
MAKIKRQFIVTITADENGVKEKYPNYQFNYDRPEQLINSVANDIKFIAGVDMSKDGMKLFGYSVEINPIVPKAPKKRTPKPKGDDGLSDMRADLYAQDTWKGIRKR